MLASERRDEIVRLLGTQGRLEGPDLAVHFGTSGETIRKDLIALESHGMLRRVHGGALRTETMTYEASLSARTEHDDEKSAIAWRALDEVPRDGAVVIDAGTTTQKFADLLSGRPGLQVFTNSLPIAAALAERAGTVCHTFGGRLRGLTMAEVGPMALSAIEPLHFDVAFVGTNGLDAGGLSTPDPEEAAIKQRMITSSDYVVLLCDDTKFATTALVTYASLENVDLLITNAAPTGELATALTEHGVEVQLA